MPQSAIAFSLALSMVVLASSVGWAQQSEAPPLPDGSPGSAAAPTQASGASSGGIRPDRPVLIRGINQFDPWTESEIGITVASGQVTGFYYGSCPLTGKNHETVGECQPEPDVSLSAAEQGFQPFHTVPDKKRPQVGAYIRALGPFDPQKGLPLEIRLAKGVSRIPGHHTITRWVTASGTLERTGSGFRVIMDNRPITALDTSVAKSTGTLNFVCHYGASDPGSPCLVDEDGKTNVAKK